MFFVRNITWERIHLNVEAELDDRLAAIKRLRFFIANQYGEVKVELKETSRDGLKIALTLNITNNGLNRCIGNGTYKIYAADDVTPIETALFDGGSETLAAFGRSFNYLSNKGVYTVNFMVDEYSQEPELQVLIYNAQTNAYSDMKLPGAPTPPTFVRKARNKVQKVITKLYRVDYNFNRRFRKGKKKHLLFLSEKSEQLALNMEAIYNRMRERGLDKDFVIEFSLRNTEDLDYSKRSSAGMIAKIGRADVIIVDDHIPFFNNFLLSDDTVLIQVWHAGAGFKGVGYSRWGHYGCPGIFSCHRQYTYCISGSKEINHFFSEQFGILDEQIIPTGMPRMDQYLDKSVREETTKRIYEQYPSLKGRKVILFAPTYRGQNRQNAYYPYELIDFDGLYRYAEKNNAAVLFKMHPWVPGDVPIEERYADRFISMNSYPNINELFYITDLLITDYSSSMYEFLLMEKPMLFFPFDKNRYSVSRGFHRDYDSNVPGKICYTFAEILDAMENEDFEFEKVGSMLNKYFDKVDTHNCDRVIDWLVLGNLPEEYTEALEKKHKEIEIVRNLQFAPEMERDEANRLRDIFRSPSAPRRLN